MYNAFIHTHSGLRWIVLLLIIACVIAAAGALGGKPLSASVKKLSFFALISTHVQTVIGLVLYFISPYVQFSSETMKNDQYRFYTMEHILMMFIAVVLVTIGNRQAKVGNGKKMFWYYFIALVIILAAIPWPFRTQLGGGWF